MSSNVLTGVIPMTDPGLQVVGRVDLRDPTAIPLHWSGSMVRANFSGTSLALKASSTQDLGGRQDERWVDYLWVMIDGREDQAVTLELARKASLYPVAGGLAEGVHSVVIVKKSDRSFVRSSF